MYVCPHCQKSLKSKRSLDEHVKKYHAGQQEPPRENDNREAQELEVQAPGGDAGDDEKYECGACHKRFSEKLERCPGCGEVLSWEGIE